MSLKLLKQGIGSITLLSLFILGLSSSLQAQSCRTPANIMVNKVTTNSATISWDRTNNAQQYELRYRLTNDLTWLTRSTQDTFVVITGLSIDKVYECEIRSLCNQNRVSQYSKSVWFNTASVWNQTATGDLYLANPNAQIGIGSVPSAKLHVLGSGLFEGTNGGTPIAGAGTRMMWVPNKSAFRAGTVTGSQWDDANIGIGSIAMGENSLASGTNSFAFGKQTEATASNSFAYGYGIRNTATNSLVFGFGKLDENGVLTSQLSNNVAKSIAFYLDNEQPVLIGQPEFLVTPPEGCSQVFKWEFNGNLYAQSFGDPCKGFICADKVISAETIEARQRVDFTGQSCADKTETPGFRIWRGNNNTSLNFGTLRINNIPEANLMRLRNNGTFEIGATLNRTDVPLTIFGIASGLNGRDRRSIITNGNITIERNLQDNEQYSPCFQVLLNGDENSIKTTKAFSFNSTINGSPVSTTIWGNGNFVTTGNVCAKEVIVRLDYNGRPCVPDYVFEDTYKLMPLNQLEYYLKTNKHLPEIPSEKELVKTGMDLGQMNLLLLKKVEELTLHIIDLNKRISDLEKQQTSNSR